MKSKTELEPWNLKTYFVSYIFNFECLRVVENITLSFSREARHGVTCTFSKFRPLYTRLPNTVLATYSKFRVQRACVLNSSAVPEIDLHRKSVSGNGLAKKSVSQSSLTVGLFCETDFFRVNFAKLYCS